MRHLLIIIATENREEGMICRMLFQNPRASNASAAQIKIATVQTFEPDPCQIKFLASITCNTPVDDCGRRHKGVILHRLTTLGSPRGSPTGRGRHKRRQGRRWWDCEMRRWHIGHKALWRNLELRRRRYKERARGLRERRPHLW